MLGRVYRLVSYAESCSRRLFRRWGIHNHALGFVRQTGSRPPEHSVSPTTGPGELWIRGPSVMKGYLNNPTATENSITSGAFLNHSLTGIVLICEHVSNHWDVVDGWFKTGDVAVRDHNGNYWIVDRKKELIKYKGCVHCLLFDNV